MRRAFLASFFTLVSVIAFADSETLQLFLKAKEQFRFGQYADALVTLDLLQVESETPGSEQYRAQLAPGLAFYRGAILAALGRPEEARPQLEVFLTYQPNASLDPAVYPPKVIAAVDETRRAMNASARKPAETGSLAAAYRAYSAPVEKGAEEAGEDWAEGPVRYLLTADQRADYERLSGPASRAEYVTEFWKARDPKPETPGNDVREEFERRVAFADARFSQDETRGSITDRGMVFVLLGPPTWVGRKPLVTGEDSDEHKGMSIYSDLQISSALKVINSSAGSARVYDRMTGPNTKILSPEGNYREVWHYRRELLPAGISFHQVDFDFITRKGYGQNVWQREARTLTTLETARAAVKSGVFTRTVSH